MPYTTDIVPSDISKSIQIQRSEIEGLSSQSTLQQQIEFSKSILSPILHTQTLKKTYPGSYFIGSFAKLHPHLAIKTN